MVPKNAQKPPNFKRLLVPKRAHLHWAQDQGVTYLVISQVQTQILIKLHLQNLDQAFTSKSQPNITISTKLKIQNID